MEGSIEEIIQIAVSMDEPTEDIIQIAVSVEESKEKSLQEAVSVDESIEESLQEAVSREDLTEYIMQNQTDNEDVNGNADISMSYVFDSEASIVYGGESNLWDYYNGLQNVSFTPTEDNHYDGLNSINDIQVSVSRIEENKLNMSIKIDDKFWEPEYYLPSGTFKQYNVIDKYLTKKKSELTAKKDGIQLERYQILEAIILHDFCMQNSFKQLFIVEPMLLPIMKINIGNKNFLEYLLEVENCLSTKEASKLYRHLYLHNPHLSIGEVKI